MNFFILIFQTGHCSPPQQGQLIQFVLTNIVDFSTNKYASNVVESCICLATIEQRQHVMQIICDLEQIRLHMFCIDASANYVVQKLMTTATAIQLDTLYMKLSPYFSLMEHYAGGRKIMDKLNTANPDRRINELAMALHQLWIGNNPDVFGLTA